MSHWTPNLSLFVRALPTGQVRITFIYDLILLLEKDVKKRVLDGKISK